MIDHGPRPAAAGKPGPPIAVRQGAATVFVTNLSRVTLTALALPYVIFFLGWLRPVYALPLSLGVVAGCWWAARDFAALAADSRDVTVSGRAHVAVVLIALAWTLVSGAGGFAHQSEDYFLHNGRLRDLVAYSWPVVYPNDQPLVYYSGYYLPAALLGKLAGYALAYRAMAAWTALLVALAFYWIFAVLGRASIPALLAFVVFSGLDAIGASLFGVPTGNPADAAEWWAFEDLFYVAYQSTTFQLFWAPHQTVVSWILAAMLVYATIGRSARSIVFLLSLTCLWSPFIGITLSPFVAFALLSRGRESLREAWSPQNAIALATALLFLVYFTSGSALTNPRGWLWDSLDLRDSHNLVRLLWFYVLEFGVLAALAWPSPGTPALETRCMAFGVAMLALLPFYRYGLWNDLLVRGAVPYIWMLFWMVQRALHEPVENRHGQWRRGLLLSALLVGALTPLASFRQSLANPDVRRAPISAPDHAYATQFLGTMDSAFYRYVAR